MWRRTSSTFSLQTSAFLETLLYPAAGKRHSRSKTEQHLDQIRPSIAGPAKAVIGSLFFYFRFYGSCHMSVTTCWHHELKRETACWIGVYSFYAWGLKITHFETKVKLFWPGRSPNSGQEHRSSWSTSCVLTPDNTHTHTQHWYWSMRTESITCWSCRNLNLNRNHNLDLCAQAPSVWRTQVSIIWGSFIHFWVFHLLSLSRSQAEDASATIQAQTILTC